jgi:hypothetical protein
MSDSDETPKPDTYGCCEMDIPQPKLFNRPGLSALKYRIGTHSLFLRRMLAKLSRQTIPDGSIQGARPLAALTIRSSDDPAIALLDAWATAADVLAFYQERIANEGYLRTATERRSVLELARSIGYELNPGVAAGTFLAFTVEDAPGAPGTATIPKGTQVQSIPPQGKLPQTFETIEDFEARKEWNKLQPRVTRPQKIAINKDSLYLIDTIGSDNDIKINQIYLKGTSTNLKTGDILLFVGKNTSGEAKTLIRLISHVEVELKFGRTRVELGAHEEPPPFTLPLLEPMSEIETNVGFNTQHIHDIVLSQSLRERDLNAFLAINRWNTKDLLDHITTFSKSEILSDDLGVFAFRQKVGFFGHNAPLFGSLPKGDNLKADPYSATDANWDAANKNAGRSIWEDSWGNNYSVNSGINVFLERSLPEVRTNSWVVFECIGVEPKAYWVNYVSEVSITGYGLSAKATGLLLKLTTDPEKTDPFRVRKTTAHVQSEQLELAELPIENPLEEEGSDGKKVGVPRLMLNGLVLGLQAGQALILSGEQADAKGVIQNEAVILSDIIHHKGYTVLYFNKRLHYRYLRETVKIHANVVRATHGETVKTEVLGNGNGSMANQRFELKKPPLTYISAVTPSGGKSTLEVRVNEVLWQEVPSLYGLDANSQSYIVRMDNDGKAVLIFGDGNRGARLPSGMENIVALYRSGIGPEGEVDAGSLTLLKTRPLGVREATNPLPASGAEAPEKLDNARVNAPLTVLTLDRIVSLEDFEDFARSFAGIGKAQAVALWSGETRIVHITVAAANGGEINTDSALFKNLRDAINTACNPELEVRIESYNLRCFNVAGSVIVDPRYIATHVIAHARDALQSSFAFGKRAFAQPVTAAEVVSVIHAVKGVVAVDLDKLYLVTTSGESVQPQPASILQADIAHWDNNEIQPAELLLINPVGIELEAKKP